jgi:hypothetical protein
MKILPIIKCSAFIENHISWWEKFLYFLLHLMNSLDQSLERTFTELYFIENKAINLKVSIFVKTEDQLLELIFNYLKSLKLFLVSKIATWYHENQNYHLFQIKHLFAIIDFLGYFKIIIEKLTVLIITIKDQNFAIMKEIIDKMIHPLIPQEWLI